MLRKKIFPLLLALLPLLVLGGLPHKNSSVLSTGRWFKLAVTKTGIARVTYHDLASMGITPGTTDVAKIRLFGNGPGMLPETNSYPRYDDLREIAIQVEDGGDGRLDTADYILFYGEGPDKWSYEGFNRFFSHQRNLYSDTTYYFLNFDQGQGRRVELVPPVAAPTTYFSGRFDDYQLHELDQLNLIKSGKDWYGEFFDNSKSTWDIPFYFPNADSLTPAKIRTNVAANASVPSYFVVFQNGNKIDSLKVDSSNPAEFTQAGFSKLKQSTILNPHSDLTITLTYMMPEANSHGWLNYIEANCSRLLKWAGPQMAFRDFNSLGAGKVTEFSIKNATSAVRVWDVTNPVSVKYFSTVISDGTLKFKQLTDTLRELVAFDGSAYNPVRCVGEIPNQNLHADDPAALIIVSNPLFLAQAERLAAFHRQHNGLTVHVVSSDQVFNEFACGQQDPTAIRDYMKLLYDKDGTAGKLRYLLLFGDGSYDPKNRVPGNNNMIPTFQSLESLNSTKSYVSDDYFGIMADNSGQEANGKIDLGIGRLPVSDTSQARTMVDKIIHYSSLTYPVQSDWRNTMTFVADDENNNLHLNQAEELTTIVANSYPLFNVNKIYFDAYKLIEIPGGSRFPDANHAINDAVSKGSLIINYTGHGGEAGWSFEQALTTTDINSWTNADKLPVFVTATCEFSRFDNPERFTAGEMVILHPHGGAIGLYSTTRLAFAGLNILLDTSFFRHLMDKAADGQYVKMGDLIRISKNNNNNNFQLRNFVLLGDPAQGIAFADYNVRTTAINGQPVNHPDTVRGLSTVTVTGVVEDGGQKVTSFNGTVNCKVYDKPMINTTLGNRPGADGSYPEDFKIQNSVLYQGDVPVNSGEFQFTYVVPRGISLQYGKGKLSYYAYDSLADASGYSDQVVIGGRDNTVNPENQGPEIGLWLNDHDFISGQVIGKSPTMLAELYDTNGINSFGLGIGHEIEAVLDHDRAHSVILNDYFKPVYNSFTRGSLTYLFTDIAAGVHTLSLKAWDLFDNSSEKEISFTIPSIPALTAQNVRNAPNPMSDHTSFIFQAHQVDFTGLDVTIQIFNMHGLRVRTLSASLTESSSAAGSSRLTWDGTDSHGQKLSNGVYPYKISFSGKNGGYSETSQKLVIIR
ncbi:MAG: type IX secretion system sortase PorU [Bacteroidota bacterium]